ASIARHDPARAAARSPRGLRGLRQSPPSLPARSRPQGVSRPSRSAALDYPKPPAPDGVARDAAAARSATRATRAVRRRSRGRDLVALQLAVERTDQVDRAAGDAGQVNVLPQLPAPGIGRRRVLPRPHSAHEGTEPWPEPQADLPTYDLRPARLGAAGQL